MPEFHIFFEYEGNTTGIVVPQRVFVVPNSPNWHRLPDIKFHMHGIPGLRLQDALDLFASSNGIPGLKDSRSTPLITERGTRATLRIMWPGYELWSDANSIHQYDHRQTVNRRPLEFIAHQVARSVKAFYDAMRGQAGTERDWELSAVPFEELYLLELHHVSQGSWQPVLARRME